MGSWSLGLNTLGGNPPNGKLGASDSSPVVIETASTERLRVDELGNVGIGTQTPAAKLDVAGGLNAVGAESHLASAAFSDPNSGVLRDLKLGANGLAVNGGVVVTTGSVGIGNTTPVTSLHVVGASDQRSTIAISRSDNNKFVRLGVGSGGVALDFDSTSDLVVQNNSGLGIGGILNGIELLRVSKGGNVGIGTATPASKLDVAGDISARTNLQVTGNVSVGGDVSLTGGDCAEYFDLAGVEAPEPGTVVVIGSEGSLRESREPYDKRVAGVVSGAGEYRHALVLDRRTDSEGRVAVALIGKVCCKVDADYSPIEIGDLLTTSATPGCAMKAGEPMKAFGAVIGKALRPMERGKGLIPILIALQ